MARGCTVCHHPARSAIDESIVRGESFRLIARRSGTGRSQGQVVEQSQRIFEVEKENQDLKKKLQLKAAMQFRPPYYYQEGDDVPFCPNCWESKTVAVHLARIGGSKKACPTCKTDYEPGPSVVSVPLNRY